MCYYQGCATKQIRFIGIYYTMEHDLIYYIDLQRRLQDVFLYVSCDEDNFNVYSVKIEGILIETCSFFDSLCQVFIQNLIKKNHKFTKENEIEEIHKKLDTQNRRKHFNIQDYEKLLNVDFYLHDKPTVSPL